MQFCCVGVCEFKDSLSESLYSQNSAVLASVSSQFCCLRVCCTDLNLSLIHSLGVCTPTIPLSRSSAISKSVRLKVLKSVPSQFHYLRILLSHFHTLQIPSISFCFFSSVDNQAYAGGNSPSGLFRRKEGINAKRWEKDLGC